MATSFFNKTQVQQSQKKESELTAIAVGGEQFHAVAVALLDSFKRSIRSNDVALKQILERLFILYPKFNTKEQFVTASERLQMLFNHYNKSELVDCFADVLKQLTWDEIEANSPKYRQVFDDLPPNTPLSYLRHPNTKLPMSALEALSLRLDLWMNLKVVERDKPIWSKVHYGNEHNGKPKYELDLQVRGNQYFPFVKHPGDFAYVGKIAGNQTKASEHKIDTHHTIANNLAEIHEDNRRFQYVFEQHHRRLMSMLDAGEITKAQLIDLYIEFLPAKRNLYTNTPEYYKRFDEANQKPNSSLPANADTEISHLLIDSISSWIANKLIDVDVMYEKLEGKSSSKGLSA